MRETRRIIVSDTKLAAQLFTVREFTQTAKELAETLKKIRKIGYKAVQISKIGADIDPKAVKSMLDGEGLVCCITHVPWESLTGDLPAVIDQHYLWDCKHIAIGRVPYDYIEWGVEGWKAFAGLANEVGRKLYEAKLDLSYHNHTFELARAEGKTLLDMLFDSTDPRYLKAELDTYWIVHGGADPAAWILKMKDRMPVIHIKDIVIQGYTREEAKPIMAEVGEGNLNWPAILAALREANVEWYAVEQDICQRDPFESLAISYKNLRAMGVE
jgi:sugar phosphate isomerase/epimerase